MKKLLVILALITSACGATTTINEGHTCIGPSQSATCQIDSIFSFTFGSKSIYNPYGETITLDGIRYDIVWTKKAVGDQNYIFTGTFNNGLDSASQTMHLACRSGRGGGCQWTNLGGSTTIQ